MKIVDGFSFYNELDMLECRLATMNEDVDHFILVEATHTHSGKEKTLYYEQNKERYAKWSDKIIHIVVRDMPLIFPNINYEKDEQWKNEHHQRDCIVRGLDTLALQPEDVILISDLDEIFNPSFLKRVRSGEVPISYTGVTMDLYYYNLNSFVHPVWKAARLITYAYFKMLQRTPTELRLNKSDDVNGINQHGGWHLSFFGDTAFIRNKLENFAHQEHNKPEYTNEERIDTRVRERRFLVDDATLNAQISYVPVPGDRPLPPNYEIYLRKFYASP
jgi:beta-1,4-mannosyl-glycoprotein beta-1,4-N-acetylglucosaminyltransferase